MVASNAMVSWPSGALCARATVPMSDNTATIRTSVMRLHHRILFSSTPYALQPCHASAGTVLILLGRAAANPAGAFHDTIADDRHRALTGDHVPTLGCGDATDDGW